MPTAGKVLFLAVALLVAGAARPANWMSQVSETEAGGHRMGNPDAKVQLIEFVSYTCSHCAHFHKEADGAIKLAWVAPGNVSLEVRYVIRNPVDLAAALLAECGPKEKFFANHSAFLNSQDTWIERITSASGATQARWSSGTIPQRMRAIASDTGFYDMMAARGYDRVAANRCLSDEAAARRIAAQSEAGVSAFGLTGTPSFVVNGQLLADTHTWDNLQQEIIDALKQ